MCHLDKIDCEDDMFFVEDVRYWGPTQIKTAIIILNELSIKEYSHNPERVFELVQFVSNTIEEKCDALIRALDKLEAEVFRKSEARYASFDKRIDGTQYEKERFNSAEKAKVALKSNYKVIDLFEGKKVSMDDLE